MLHSYGYDAFTEFQGFIVDLSKLPEHLREKKILKLIMHQNNTRVSLTPTGQTSSLHFKYSTNLYSRVRLWLVSLAAGSESAAKERKKMSDPIIGKTAFLFQASKFNSLVKLYTKFRD